MVPRSDSMLSAYPRYRNTGHPTRKRSRLPLMAAAALAAGALSASAVMSGGSPWAEVSGKVTASTHIASEVLAGQAGTSIFDSVVGLKSPTAAQQPAAEAVHLDALVVRKPGAPAGPAAPAAPRAPAAAAPRARQKPAAAAPAPAAAAPRVPQKPAAAAPAPALASDWARALANAPVSAASAPAHVSALSVPAARIPAQAPMARPAQAVAAKAMAARPKVQPKAAPPRPAAPAAPAKPYQIYDSVTPTAIPWGHQVAVYSNGAYQATWASVAGRGPALWIDTNGSDPGDNVLDVEPGDATPAGAAQWVKARLSRYNNSLPIVYTMLSEWQAVKDSVHGLPSWMQSKVRYWIADPTGVQHVVPGSNATQWYWGTQYDITTANPDFQAP